MDKVIVTVLLIIGGVVAAFAIINGVYAGPGTEQQRHQQRHRPGQ